MQQLAEYVELSIEDVVDALQAARGHHSTSLVVADQIGVSQMQVCRTLSRALNRLRELTANDGCCVAPPGPN